MKKEITTLEENKTWDIKTLPKVKRALGRKWVYKLKYNVDGTIERHKAGLVVFGNHQVEGLDYTKTFAPTSKMVTVRMFVAISTIVKWELH